MNLILLLIRLGINLFNNFHEWIYLIIFSNSKRFLWLWITKKKKKKKKKKSNQEHIEKLIKIEELFGKNSDVPKNFWRFKAKKKKKKKEEKLISR